MRTPNLEVLIPFTLDKTTEGNVDGVQRGAIGYGDGVGGNTDHGTVVSSVVIP